jgi:hypothetical protein
MDRCYIINNKVYTSNDVIKNALDQEASGIRPHYSFYDYSHKEVITPPGWLVASAIKEGVIVVYRRDSDGKMCIATGVQGDFIYM